MVYILFSISFMLAFYTYCISKIWKHEYFMILVSSIINIGGLLWFYSIRNTKPEVFESIRFFIAFLPVITFIVLFLLRHGGKNLGEILETVTDIF